VSAQREVIGDTRVKSMRFGSVVAFGKMEMDRELLKCEKFSM
jgi:hypothetical protein